MSVVCLYGTSANLGFRPNAQFLSCGLLIAQLLARWLCLLKANANQVDVLLQRVEQVRERNRHMHSPSAFLQLAQLFGKPTDSGSRRISLELGLEELELAVQAKDATAHTPTINRRQPSQ